MASTQNALNNMSSTSVASTIQSYTINNSDNTGTSAASLAIEVGGGTTSGDPQITYTVTGVTNWSEGIDNSASDQFVIASNTDLGTTPRHVIETSGFNRWPVQPCFLGILSANDNNRTGAGAPFTLGSGTSVTEIFDKGSNYSGTVFTCPVTGLVLLSGAITLTGCTINNGIQVQMVTSNRTYVQTIFRPAASTDNSQSLDALADMDSGDTVSFRVVGLGEAGNTDDLVGGTATAVTYFCGYRMG